MVFDQCAAAPLLLLLLSGAPPGPAEESLARKLLELVTAAALSDAAGLCRYMYVCSRNVLLMVLAAREAPPMGLVRA